MKTYILIYNEFAHFEVVLASLFLKSKGEIVTVGTSNDEVISEEGFKLIPHMVLSEVRIDDVDLFIVPGGNPKSLANVPGLSEFLVNLNNKNKIIGAICAGPLQLARAGLLKNRKFTTSMPVEEYEDFAGGEYIDCNVIVDGNIVTAKGCGYVDFALILGKVMNIYEDEGDYEETVRYFKDFIG